MDRTDCHLRTLSGIELPSLLGEIPDAPRSLYVRGTLPDESQKYLAVVGSRTYTPYGKQACEMLVAGLRGFPIVIVSGLALGIDGIAHRAALAAGLPTIAIPGSGLDDRVLYPAAHRSLAHDILQSGGALVSEFDPLWKPRPESFPQRNRIMAGLSHAVLVIEAEVRSGTLITARLAADYNRDVLAVPGPIQSATSSGPHLLIKKGAALITHAHDILEALGIDQNQVTSSRVPADLCERERQILSLLTTPLSRDEIAAQAACTVSDISITLTSLELRGLIAERSGKVHATHAH